MNLSCDGCGREDICLCLVATMTPTASARQILQAAHAQLDEPLTVDKVADRTLRHAMEHLKPRRKAVA